MTTPATATDELPRVLEVSRFAAARQAEVSGASNPLTTLVRIDPSA